ncbi:hypothetical protein SAY86_012017 [Trapa natans]|uniref:Uncharacterized protein n=1 Tax=Trapa natans TaxID=22666 RepID=A0AAN7LRH5_TRANT|nr:hypothetical protein SAY86_012017 [Trapa natans]
MLWSAFKWEIKIVSIMMRSPLIIHIVFIASSHYKVAPLTLETTASSPVRGPSLSTCSHTYPQVMSSKSGGISTTIFHVSYKPKPKPKPRPRPKKDILGIVLEIILLVTVKEFFLSGGCMVAMDNHDNDQGVASDLSTRGLSRSKPLESIPPPLSSVRLFPYRRYP